MFYKKLWKHCEYIAIIVTFPLTFSRVNVLIMCNIQLLYFQSTSIFILIFYTLNILYYFLYRGKSFSFSLYFFNLFVSSCDLIYGTQSSILKIKDNKL